MRTIPASKELNTLIAPSSLFAQSVVSGRARLYRRNRRASQRLVEWSRFHRNFQIPEHAQTVYIPGSFFPTHAQETGNEANTVWAPPLIVVQ